MYNNDYLISPHSSTITEPSGLESWLGATTGIAIAAVILLILILIAVGVLMIIAECKIISKAGDKWWKGLIPGYSTWTYTKITGLAWWWFPIFFRLLALQGDFSDAAKGYISILVFLTSFNYHFNLSKKFGKTNGFAVLLTLLPVIGYPILAFGAAKYNKDAKVDKNGIFQID